MIYTAETRVFFLNTDKIAEEIIQQAASVLQTGGLVAFPTETVYGLGANAQDAAAVDRIYSAKQRPASDPMIVHLHTHDQLEQIAVNIPDLAYQLTRTFWPGPLTLVLKRHASIPANVSAGLDTLAVRMPNHPIALALLREANLPVAAPSANRFSRPSATTAQHVLDDLQGHVDVVLDAGSTNIGVESTVLDVTKDTPTVLRPGGVPLEKLRTFIPDLQIQVKHLQEDDAPGSSPGMLTKHYSPRAELLLFTGDFEPVITQMQHTAGEYLAQGKRVGIMTPDTEVNYFDQSPVEIVTLGDTLEAISHNLFTRMRELDNRGVDIILVRKPEQTGLGTAIGDRLWRAAEGHVIKVNSLPQK